MPVPIRIVAGFHQRCRTGLVGHDGWVAESMLQIKTTNNMEIQPTIAPVASELTELPNTRTLIT
jgi:hypothetical protein